MNRRQAKKKYKKKHGHNPISIKQATSLSEILSVLIESCCDYIKETLKSFNKLMDDTFTIIKEMPDEEFEELAQQLEPSARAMAQRIRDNHRKG